MKDFVWNIQKFAESPFKEDRIERGDFFHPHEDIWPSDDDKFVSYASGILANLNNNQQKFFLSVCLASYLLNPEKSPTCFQKWFSEKSSLEEILGLELTWDELMSWTWGRAAFPAVDLIQGWNNKAIYSLVGCTASETSRLQFPPWVQTCLNRESTDAVNKAANLLAERGQSFFFWPMIDFTSTSTIVKGGSLGLPLYLSFYSLVMQSPIPTILATGALGDNGAVAVVGGLEKKMRLAHSKGFTGFIYPSDNEIFLDSSDKISPIEVQTIEQAEAVWLGKKMPITDNFMMLMRNKEDIGNTTPASTDRDQLTKDLQKLVADTDLYENKISPLLCRVMAAFEPLTFGFLFQTLKLNNRKKLYETLYLLREHILIDGDGDSAVIKIKHDFLKEWLTNRKQSGPCFIDIEYGHYQLAEFGWELFITGRALPSYFLFWLLRHLDVCGRTEDIIDLLKDFSFMMARVKAGMLEKTLDEYRNLPFQNIEELRSNLRLETAFFCEMAHILRRGDQSWPAHKILLQLAIEHADDSPLTKGAEKFLQQGKCNWAWLRRNRRRDKAGINPCLAVFEGHSDSVVGALVLQNKRILSWSSDHTLRLWDQHGGAIKVLAGHHGPVRGALLLADSQILSWSDDSTLRLWEQSGTPLLTFEGHRKRVEGALLLPNDNILSWSDDSLRIWNINGKCLKVIRQKNVKEVLLLPNNRILLKTWFGAPIKIWDLNGECIKTMKGHKSGLMRILILPDNRILSCSQDNTLRIWDPDGSPVNILKGHTDSVLDAQSLPNGRILSMSLDRTLRIWNQNGVIETVYSGHNDYPRGALLLPDNNILSWGDNGTLHIWNQNGETLAVMSMHSDRVKGVQSLLDGHIISWSMDSNICIWNNIGNHLSTFKGHGSYICGATSVFMPNRHLLTWSGDNTLRLWDIDRDPLNTLDGHSSYVDGLIQLSSERMLSWSSDSLMQIWDKNGNLLNKLVSSIAGALPLPDDRFITWSEDNILRIRDKNGKIQKLLKGHKIHDENFKEMPAQLLLLPDKRILTWSECTLCLWGQDGTLVKKLVGHKDTVFGALSLPNGNILSWEPESIRLWDANGNPLKVLSGHECWIEEVLLLPDGRFWSWSSESTRIWDQKGNQLKMLDGNDSFGESCFVQLLSNGRIISNEEAGRTRIWDQNGVLLKEVKHYEDPNGTLLTEWESWNHGAGWVYEIKQLDGGEILYRDCHNMIALFDPDGRLLWLESQHDLSHPSGLEILDKSQSVARSVLSSKSNTIQVRVVDGSRKSGILWQGQSGCNVGYLFEDGRAVIPQENGQVCFLQLYIGNRPACIEELERLAGT